MIDFVAPDNGRTWDATDIFTVPLLRTMEVPTDERREFEVAIQAILSSISPLAKHRIPGTWNT
ncbi:hypothetical protein N7491_003953 [Penicillium cf. griseofulvum]|nr:hypothetical protein N7491_003953 [Penicillium cf. griseofulvum]